MGAERFWGKVEGYCSILIIMHTHNFLFLGPGSHAGAFLKYLSLFSLHLSYFYHGCQIRKANMGTVGFYTHTHIPRKNYPKCNTPQQPWASHPRPGKRGSPHPGLQRATCRRGWIAETRKRTSLPLPPPPPPRLSATARTHFSTRSPQSRPGRQRPEKEGRAFPRPPLHSSRL